MKTRVNHLHPILILYNLTISPTPATGHIATITPQVFEDDVMPVVRGLERQIQESVFKDCGLNIALTHSHIAGLSNPWVNKLGDSYDWTTNNRPWILANIVMPTNYYRYRYGCFRLRNRIKTYKGLWDKFVADTMMGVVIDL